MGRLVGFETTLAWTIIDLRGQARQPCTALSPCGQVYALYLPPAWRKIRTLFCGRSNSFLGHLFMAISKSVHSRRSFSFRLPQAFIVPLARWRAQGEHREKQESSLPGRSCSPGFGTDRRSRSTRASNYAPQFHRQASAENSYRSADRLTRQWATRLWDTLPTLYPASRPLVLVTNHSFMHRAASIYKSVSRPSERP